MYFSLVSVLQSNLVMVKNKINSKKYYKVETVVKSNRKKSQNDTLTHKYMTAHFPGLVQALL